MNLNLLLINITEGQMKVGCLKYTKLDIRNTTLIVHINVFLLFFYLKQQQQLQDFRTLLMLVVQSQGFCYDFIKLYGNHTRNIQKGFHNFPYQKCQRIDILEPIKSYLNPICHYL